MKKLITILAALCIAAITQAAAVGWSVAGGNAAYGNKAYSLFVIGQNGVTDIGQIQAILDAGTDFSSYVFGSGTTTAAGTGAVSAGVSGKTLDAGTYTAFVAFFDSDTVTADSSQYALFSGATTLTQTIGASTAKITFATGSMKNFLDNSSNWHSYGAAPEPACAMLFVLGAAGLALRRRVKIA
ncbi:MAG: PEP-CTERM sorting domain-containing protein [Kiritimatiellia bacterium]|nr:PEP-CTERM sorting domain-containing protein [Kiritimatiellia bacterium]